ncbi:disulfide bond formation protein B [Polaromonas sp. P1-6]|nr:disulfide bond formation protein B [Polaromonas sp. P1-6]
MWSAWSLAPCASCSVTRWCWWPLLRASPRLPKAGACWSPAQGVLVLVAGFGAFVAARQSFLQWYPPEVASCGRDFYGMIETFPLKRAIPMIFKGSGDCTKIDWTFLGGSIANWSFLCFVAIGLVGLVLIARLARQR